MPQFEFDVEKSDANLKKHGIDFVTAQELWNDENRFIISAKSKTETRYAAFGKIGVKLWTAVYTMRDENIRLISVRRSRDDETEIYNG